MLKYFKRQKNQRSGENYNDVAANTENGKRDSLLSTSSFCDEFLLAEEDSKSLQSGVSVEAMGDEDIFNYNSRLSMSLSSILKDPECLICLVQYLEAKNVLPIIKFYLDTENFKISALEQLANHETSTSSMSEGFKQSKNEAFNNNNNYDGEKSNCLEEAIGDAAKNVPELKTLYDLSMHKSLTDDEKSQLYAETNKQITKCFGPITNKHKLKACSEQSLYSELSLDGGASDDTHNSHPLCVSEVSIKDAIAIYQKYLSPQAQFFVELPVNILSDISLLLCKRQEGDDNLDKEILPISANCFDDAQKFVLNELERLYLNDFLQSSFYCNFCLELIIEEKLNIYDILYSEVTLFFFMEFLEQQGERECLDFWTSAINFRKSYAHLKLETTDVKEIQEDAMIIYKKFFSLQSDGRLWLSDKLRSRVEVLICASPEQIANCFDLALVVTAKYLERKYYTDFLKSELFTQYLNELKAKTHEPQSNADQFEDISIDNIDGDLPASSLQHKHSFKGSRKLSCTPISRRRHRKTLSDCTNDTSRNAEVLKHISQHNTLLAMDSSNMHWKNLQVRTSMSIDARQLTDPNLLWHRRNSKNESGNGVLKFGHVNALGRYERDFDTIDSFNSHWSLGVSGNKIKNAMRKLVNLPEYNAQEEIAWQMAEMIINDVTSVTLKNTPMANGKTTAIVSKSES